MKVRLLFLLMFVVAVTFACGDDGDGSSGGTGDDDLLKVPDAGTDADTGTEDDTGTTPDVAPDVEPEPTEYPRVFGVDSATDLNDDPNVVELDIAARPGTVEIAEDVDIRGYAYNGSWPGPLVQATVGDELVVHFTNELDEPTTIHWHGLRIPDDMDGSPRVMDPVEPGETFTYRFTLPEAGTFWYHPHVRSNEQVEKGLYGMLVVHDRKEPRYDKERAVLLDDILLTNSNTIPGFLQSHPEIMHGRYGNVLLTNGRAEPVTGEAAQGEVELWRIVNTANARTMVVGVTGARARVVGTDGGPVAPYETDFVEVAVGQRYELLVEYDQPGTALLKSYVPTQQGTTDFDVMAISVEDTGAAPRAIELPTPVTAGDREVTRSETIEFDTRVNVFGDQSWLLNGRANAEEPLFTFTPGETVQITLRNLSTTEHPFHLHGQFFEILTGGEPSTDEPGLKDTVLVGPRDTVRIKAYLDNPGRWMAHCHILEHAELGMMAEIVVE